MQNWYLIAVKTNQSTKAQVMLNQQDIETYSPQITINDGHKIKTEPAFSTYLFAKFDPLEKSLLAINNTRGVRHVVKFGGQLATVDPEIIDGMRYQFDDVVIDDTPKKGDAVIISMGPFAGIRAIYHERDKYMRDVLLVQLVHKSHKITVDRDHFIRA